MTKVSITEVSIQIARVSLQNGQASEEECHAAVSAACAKGVDNYCFIRSRLYLQATNGDVAQTAQWLSVENDDFGDYHDNMAALEIIRYQIKHGKPMDGLVRACRLHAFITHGGGDHQSISLIPEIEAIIAQETEKKVGAICARPISSINAYGRNSTPPLTP